MELLVKDKFQFILKHVKRRLSSQIVFDVVRKRPEYGEYYNLFQLEEWQKLVLGSM